MGEHQNANGKPGGGGGSCQCEGSPIFIFFWQTYPDLQKEKAIKKWAGIIKSQHGEKHGTFFVAFKGADHQKCQKKRCWLPKKKKKKKNRSFYDNVIINASSVNNHVQPNEFV